MTEDSLLIRAERLVKGDIVLWANVSWRIELIEPVSPTEFEIALEYVHGGCDDHSDLRTVVSRDRKLRVLRLV